LCVCGNSLPEIAIGKVLNLDISHKGTKKIKVGEQQKINKLSGFVSS
jgi:hypothetical protein